jgi:hypothetical protein
MNTYIHVNSQKNSQNKYIYLHSHIFIHTTSITILSFNSMPSIPIININMYICEYTHTQTQSHHKTNTSVYNPNYTNIWIIYNIITQTASITILSFNSVPSIPILVLLVLRKCPFIYVCIDTCYYKSIHVYT